MNNIICVCAYTKEQTRKPERVIMQVNKAINLLTARTMLNSKKVKT
jgi:hypothetical protein